MTLLLPLTFDLSYDICIGYYGISAIGFYCHSM